jgi:hypothetical protein
VGSKSNRSALGATVTVHGANWRQSQVVRSGSSYCSQSDLALTFGLGEQSAASAVEVVWPSGARQRFTNVAANRHYVVHEGSGINALK